MYLPLSRHPPGATGPLCRAIVPRSLEWAAFLERWRDCTGLSCHYHWRDSKVLPRQPVSQPRIDCICGPLAWQEGFVAPFLVARRCLIVAPLSMARQGRSAAPACVDAQKGLHLCPGGVTAQICRAIQGGATSAIQKRDKALLLLSFSLPSFPAVTFLLLGQCIVCRNR